MKLLFTSILLFSFLFAGFSCANADTTAGQAANPAAVQNANPPAQAGAVNGGSVSRDTVQFVLNKEIILLPGKKYNIRLADNFEQSGYRVTKMYVCPETEESCASPDNLEYAFVYGEKEKKTVLSIELPETASLLSSKGALYKLIWALRGKLYIDYVDKAGNNIKSPSVDVLIPNYRSAVIWGAAVLVAFFVVVFVLMKDGILKIDEKLLIHNEKNSNGLWKDKNRLNRFFLFPLRFAITPVGAYSISITQVIIWTYITTFGLIFVYRLTGNYLAITEQMLDLIGIGSITALSSKLNAMSKAKVEIPAKYFDPINMKRIPQLSDLISIGGVPNVYKFQMLVFTLITAAFVVVDLIKNCEFPEIPGSLITMMGISSAVYLGNEVTQETVWDKIKKNLEIINRIEKELIPLLSTNPATRTPEQNNIITEKQDAKEREERELLEYLNRIYS